MARTQHLKLLAQEDNTPAMRPAYPEDLPSPGGAPPEAENTPAEEQMVFRTQEDWAAYPDLVYSAQAEQRGRRAKKRRLSRGRDARLPEAPGGNPAEEPLPPLPDQVETEGAFPQPEAENGSNGRVPFFPDDLPFPGDGGFIQRSAKDDLPGGETAARKPKGSGLWAGIALVCLALLVLLTAVVVSWRKSYAPFRDKVEIVSRDTIAQGVLVDNVHVGGMTKEQAAQALSREKDANGEKLQITIRVDDQTWVLTPAELTFSRNTAKVLETAYAVGRQGSVETVASSTTPFEYRYQHLYHTVGSPVSLRTEVTYDRETVRDLVGIIEANINRDAVDAQVATFDFGSRSFTFTEDRAGARIDGDDLYRQIISALDRRDWTAVIAVASERITPRVTKAELMNSFALISTYTTDTTSNANRNTNIDLAARAVSGTVVMPGETFSFNKTTGQRTAQKGYLPAAAIAGGTTVDEIGGGVCQVSSTLFNAAAMADMTILARSPHTWPSNYVDKGRDATVNWPNLDFSFRNDTNTPIFIVAWYQQRKCTVELYGALPGGGQSIELDTRLVSTQEPPAEPVYERNPSLEPGTAQEKKKARTGYTVETYKVYLRNGREVRRELLCTSVYQMIQQVIEYN